MRSVLVELDALQLNNSALILEYFGTIRGMSSNTEMGAVLRHCIDRFELDKNAKIAFFRTVKQLSSNTEMGSILRHSIEKIGHRFCI